VVLTTHPLLAPRSRKSKAIPLPNPLWAFWSVTGYLYLTENDGHAVNKKRLEEEREKQRKKQ
jgi:hypothetical protein